MFDIITLGSSTMDVFVESESNLIKVKKNNSENLFLSYPFGSKVLIKDLEHHTGGGGTNVATTLSNLGLNVGFLGSIGDDHNGYKILHELKQSKIKFLGTCQGQSGYSVILEADKDRTILTFKGCNDLVPIPEKEIKKLKAKWFYFTSMNGTSFEFSKKVALYIKNNKSKLCFNPSSYIAKKGITHIKSILKNTYCLILNSEEANMLAKQNDIFENLKFLSKRIILDGIVLITDGSKGAHAINGKNIYSIKSNSISVVETTGAGDAFGAGFVGGLILGKDISYSLKLAINNAENVIQKKGAKEGLPGNKLITITDFDSRKVKITFIN